MSADRRSAAAVWLTAEPELALLAACLRRPLEDAARDDIVRLTSAPLDWDRFVGWAQRHRAASLAVDALRQASVPVPLATADVLRKASQRLAQASLAQIAETVRLVRMLGDAGIGVLVLKGPALSQLAFGNPALRESRDVDLLVATDFAQAQGVLAAAGYARIKPAAWMSGPILGAYARFVHEVVYRSPAGIVVELKHRLHPTQELLPLDLMPLFRAPRLVVVDGHAVPTLPDVELILYLCTHGSRHGWFRFKWIADVAALFGRLPVATLDGVVARAEALGVEHLLHEAALLGHGLLQAPIPVSLLAQASADPQARRGAAAAMRNLAVYGRGGNPFAAFGFTVRLDLGEYRIRRDARYRWVVFRRHALMWPLAWLRSFVGVFRTPLWRRK